jgi:hypothetical protein
MRSVLFSSGQLRLSWGKSGRNSFWGGLARCDPAGGLVVANITPTPGFGAELRELPGCVNLFEGTAVTR